MTATGIDRRTFLRASAQAAGVLTIAFYAGPLPACRAGGSGRRPKPLPDPNAFLRIAPDGTVTVVLAHSEMGQGMWTGLVVLWPRSWTSTGPSSTSSTRPWPRPTRIRSSGCR